MLFNKIKIKSLNRYLLYNQNISSQLKIKNSCLLLFIVKKMFKAVIITISVKLVLHIKASTSD